MSENDFEKNYPREQFNYVRKSSRTRGTMGQTEIDTYDIFSKSTGELVITATRTEHTNLRGLDTTVTWDY